VLSDFMEASLLFFLQYIPPTQRHNWPAKVARKHADLILAKDSPRNAVKPRHFPAIPCHGFGFEVVEGPRRKNSPQPAPAGVVSARSAHPN